MIGKLLGLIEFIKINTLSPYYVFHYISTFICHGIFWEMQKIVVKGFTQILLTVCEAIASSVARYGFDEDTIKENIQCILISLANDNRKFHHILRICACACVYIANVTCLIFKMKGYKCNDSGIIVNI